GHREDAMSDLEMTEEDYAWITDELMAIARRHANGRVVSVLEGGYDFSSLGRSVAAHVRSMISE
ncbi:MAG: histone deacetylase family protein, partial [Proteobacteria bacterium]|nr:histone deacetylase family protein [Pseudomonadota bacterium]